MDIPFNKPAVVGNELKYFKRVLDCRRLCGDGEFTKKCCEFMEKRFKAKKILLTTSCTHAMEMTSMLIDIGEGDEVIMPSYTFPSTANAFMLRGAKPVFVDIREDTLNIDETLIEGKITDKTKAILPVHYAGVGCEMNKIRKMAKKNNLFVIEDAAQGVNAKYKNKFLGTIGDMGAYSFHETKNYVCGEGGALVINNPAFIERADIIREKGTDRKQFYRGEIDKYSWVDVGSSYLPSELQASYLYAQLEKNDKIQKKREKIFRNYYTKLRGLEEKERLRLPIVPKQCSPNFHIFYTLLPNNRMRNELMKHLKRNSIQSTFHYIPLHLSPMGGMLGYKRGDLPATEDLSERILRLPIYYNLTPQQQNKVIAKIHEFID